MNDRDKSTSSPRGATTDQSTIAKSDVAFAVTDWQRVIDLVSKSKDGFIFCHSLGRPIAAFLRRGGSVGNRIGPDQVSNDGPV